MIHVAAGTEQQAIDAGSETSSMDVEKSIINTVILMSNIAVVLFPLSLLFDKDSIESSYWKIREKIDSISCWKMSKIKSKQEPASVSVDHEVLPEAHLQCDIVKSYRLSRNKQQPFCHHLGEFVILAPHPR